MTVPADATELIGAAVAAWLVARQYTQITRSRARYVVWAVRDELVAAIADGELPRVDKVESLRVVLDWSARHSRSVRLRDLLRDGWTSWREREDDVIDVRDDGLTDHQRFVLDRYRRIGMDALLKVYTRTTVAGLVFEAAIQVARRFVEQRHHDLSPLERRGGRTIQRLGWRTLDRWCDEHAQEPVGSVQVR